MTQIKHISFDVWNTLLFPNKDYSWYRTFFIRKEMLNDTLDFEYVKNKYTEIKTALDQEAEIGMKAMSVEDNWVRLCDCFVNSNFKTHEDVTKHILPHMELLFKLHPPTLPEKTISILKELKQSGYSLSIASNTNFIGGNILYDYIQQQTGNVFSFALFSDITGCSKPSHEMFSDVQKNVSEIYIPHVTYADEILHVGDNGVCDIDGAHNYGMYALLCKTPDAMYNDLTAYIKEKQK